MRLRPEQARHVLASAFPDSCWLDDGGTSDLWSRIGELDVVGGATFDALVAAAAQANGRTLLTRDRRAERTYRVLDVEHVFVE